MAMGSTFQVGGTSSPVQAAKFEVTDTTATDRGISSVQRSADANGAVVSLKKSRNSAVGSFTAVSSADEIGRVHWGADDGSGMQYATREAGHLQMVATEAWSSTAHGSKFVASLVKATSTTVRDAFQITENGFGYVAGAGIGGAVIQNTNKSTSVTLNAPTGLIIMNNAALAAATIVSFTFTNSCLTTTDVIVWEHRAGGTLGAYTITSARAAGSCTVSVRNNTAGSLSEAVEIHFAVIKGATS